MIESTSTFKLAMFPIILCNYWIVQVQVKFIYWRKDFLKTNTMTCMLVWCLWPWLQTLLKSSHCGHCWSDGPTTIRSQGNVKAKDSKWHHAKLMSEQVKTWPRLLKKPWLTLHFAKTIVNNKCAQWFNMK